MPERKSKGAILLEQLVTVGPLVIISYIILQNTQFYGEENAKAFICFQSNNALLKFQDKQFS
jgi:hypothetical protein